MEIKEHTQIINAFKKAMQKAGKDKKVILENFKNENAYYFADITHYRLHLQKEIMAIYNNQ